MTPKEYLMQIELLDTRINQRIREKDDLTRLYGVSSADYSRERVQSAHSADAPFVKTVEKKIMLEAEIDRLIDKFVDLKNLIISQIQSLDNVQYVNILFKKYVEFKRLEVIAVEMNYSYGYIKHAHGRALSAFGQKFLKDVTQ